MGLRSSLSLLFLDAYLRLNSNHFEHQTRVGLRNSEGGQFEVHPRAVLDRRVIQERGDKVKMIDHPL